MEGGCPFAGGGGGKKEANNKKQERSKETIEQQLRRLKISNLHSVDVNTLIASLADYNELIHSLEEYKRLAFLGANTTIPVKYLNEKLEEANHEKKLVERRLEEHMAEGTAETKGEDASPKDVPTTQSFEPSSFIHDGTFTYAEEPASEHMLLREKSKLTYWNYIKPKELGDLVRMHSKHHDEHLFILVHQVFELWFKQILWELEAVRKGLLTPATETEALSGIYPPIGGEQTKLREMHRYLQRADKILRHATTAFEVLEMMDPADFLDFRDVLGDGSGFQSTQFRELELLLGVTNRPSIGGVSWEQKFESDGCPLTHKQRLDKRRTEVSLKDALYDWLHQQVDVPNLDDFVHHVLAIKQDMAEQIDTKSYDKSAAYEYFFGPPSSSSADSAEGGGEASPSSRRRVLTSSTSRNPRVLDVRKKILFLLTWRHHPRWSPIATIIADVADFEQALVIWRQRHPRMAEIMIGRRVGTGGSSGVAYLDSTSSPQFRVFPDIIRVRGEAVSYMHLKQIREDGVWAKDE
ncbi:Tryptophan 2,3-dioxygenase [Balamuthia mandrillaris]